MLEKYVGEIHPNLAAYLAEERPTTVIYPQVKGISPRFAPPMVGMRIVQDAFRQA